MPEAGPAAGDAPAVGVVHLPSGTVLASRPVLAATFMARLRGLLGRDSLEAGEALVLEPCTSVHMFFMTFALDVVFVDGQDRVVAIYPDLRPWQVSGIHSDAARTIEFAAGTLTVVPGLKVGDPLAIRPCPEAPESIGEAEALPFEDRLLRGGTAVLLLASGLLQVGDQTTFLFLVTFLAAVLGGMALARAGLRPPPPPLAALAFWVLHHGLHGMLVSPAPYAARFALARRAAQAGALAAGLAVGTIPGAPRIAAGAIATVAGLAGAGAVVEVWDRTPTPGYWLDADRFTHVKQRVASFFANPNLLGLYLAMAVPYLLLAASGPDRAARLLGAVACLLGGAGLAASYSRSSWVALVGAAALLLALRRGRFPAGAHHGAIWMVLGVLAFAPGVLERARSTVDGGEFGVRQRIELLRGVSDMVLARPLAGFGPGTFHGAYTAYRRVGGQYPFDAHNQYLQEAVETGMPGLGLYLVVLTATCAVGLARLGDDPARLAAGGAVAVFLVGSLFASPLAYTPLAILACFSLGLLASPGPGRRAKAGADQGPLTRFILGSALALGTLSTLRAALAEPARQLAAAGVRALAGLEPGPTRQRPAAELAPGILGALDRAERFDPGAPLHAYLRGETFAALGALDEALAAYREILVRDPYESRARKAMAQVFRLQGELELATEALDQGLALDPWAEDLALEKARILLMQGELEAAAGLLERALESNPPFLRINLDAYPPVLALLIEVRDRQGRGAEAERLRRRFSELWGQLRAPPGPARRP